MRFGLPLALLSLVLTAGCGSASDPDPGNEDPPPGDTPPDDPPPGGEPTLGLDARPANATCIAPELEPPPEVAVALEDAFPDLPNLDRPVALVQAPGDTSRWFVAEQRGRVLAFDNEADADELDTFVDIESSVDDGPNEAGLLGIAFHPDYADNDEVYLSYTAPGLVSRISRFETENNGMTLDPGSEDVVLSVNQDAGNHNGGHIAFGPDGYLYIGFGDGGGAGDPLSRAQDTTNLLGAMLRIDVDAPRLLAPYAIPGTNPFEGNRLCPADHSSTTACPEIFAWGLRNPWRWSFDRSTGELWAGDVGQNQWEEVDLIEANGNFGWDCREGAHDFGASAASCSTATGLVEPVAEYDHSEGVSITGGYVYRGAAIPELVGRYVFADFASATIWALEADGSGGYTRTAIAQSPQGVASFAEGPDGELYVVGWAAGDDGRIQRLVPDAGAGGPGTVMPAQLSETGCVTSADPAAPAPGLIPYEVAAPFWSDGGTKERWLALPDGTTMSVGADGDFELPAGSVLMKHFRLGDRLVETRLFMRHPDGEWAGYSYEWNAAQTDAALLSGGKVADVEGQQWIFPSGAQCLTCHTAGAGFSLGLETAQLNHDFAYPSTGRTANQLATLDGIALFDTPLGDPAAEPMLADPADTAATLDDRARAWLHTNCANCHRPGAAGGGSLDLRYGTALADTNTCDVPPANGDLGLGAAARIIAPGDPASSVLVERANRRDDAAMMPPLASNIVDTAGIQLLSDWIEGLPPGC